MKTGEQLLNYMMHMFVIYHYRIYSCMFHTLHETRETTYVVSTLRIGNMFFFLMRVIIYFIHYYIFYVLYTLHILEPKRMFLCEQ